MRFYEISLTETNMINESLVTIYHGNNYGTKIINPEHMDSSINEHGVGIYFTDNIDTAKTYGKYLVSASVDPSRFFNATDPVSKLGNSFVDMLISLYKKNPEGVWYYLTDYGIEAYTPEDVKKQDFITVFELASSEQVRHAQQTLTNYTSVEDFIAVWNEKTNYDGLYQKMQTGETFYIVSNPDIKVSVIESDTQNIQLSQDKKTKDWINKIYTMLPVNALNPDQRAVVFDNDQFALFELEPSRSKKGAVEVKWFQAYPLRQGVGTKAMQYLQDLAKKDGITLTLYPWDKGRVSQAKLTKFYKQQGFKPTAKGAKTMIWSPDKE